MLSWSWQQIFFLTAGDEYVFQDRQLVCLSFCVLQSCSLTITEWHKCRHLSGVLVERRQEMLQEIYFLSSLMGALCSLCHGCVVMILTSRVTHNLCGASADHAPLAFCNPGLCAASTAVSRRHDCTIVSVFTTIFFPSSSDHHDLGDCEPTQTVSLVIVCKLCSFVLLDF